MFAAVVVADIFEELSGRFDREKFLEACGVKTLSSSGSPDRSQ
jgi:hypothetical protein